LVSQLLDIHQEISEVSQIHQTLKCSLESQDGDSDFRDAFQETTIFATPKSKGSCGGQEFETQPAYGNLWLSWEGINIMAIPTAYHGFLVDEHPLTRPERWQWSLPSMIIPV